MQMILDRKEWNGTVKLPPADGFKTIQTVQNSSPTKLGSRRDEMTYRRQPHDERELVL